jgi:uncharacterized protein HemX
MLYTAGEIVLFLVVSGAIGLAIGYFSWGRSKGGEASTSKEVEILQRQLAATRKRAAAAETDAAKRGDELKEAKTHFDAQTSRIVALESRLGGEDPLPNSDAADDTEA